MDSHFGPWVMLHMLPKIPTIQADSCLLSGSTNTFRNIPLIHAFVTDFDTCCWPSRHAGATTDTPLVWGLLGLLWGLVGPIGLRLPTARGSLWARPTKTAQTQGKIGSLAIEHQVVSTHRQGSRWIAESFKNMGNTITVILDTVTLMTFALSKMK